MSAETTTGTLIRNTDPHQNRSNSNPPRIGPSEAPTTERLPQIAIAMFRSFTSLNDNRINASVAGIIAAAPTASSAREAISIPGLTENAAANDARPKINSPTTNILRWPIRSPSVPAPSNRPAITTG